MKQMNIIVLTTLLLISITLPGTAQPQTQSRSPWHVTATKQSPYAGISVSSGRIGIMSSATPLKTGSVYLNNVYDRESDLGVSKILRGINFANLTMVIDGDTVDEQSVSGWKQVLDMKKAMLTTSFRFKEKAEISYSVVAFRGMPYAAIMDVSVIPISRRISLTVAGEISTPKEHTVTSNSFRVLRDNEIEMPLLQTVAQSPFGKHTLATTATFIFDHPFPAFEHQVLSPRSHQLAFSRQLKKGEPYTFAWTGAICTTGDFIDPQNESERMTIFLMRGNKTAALKQHFESWEALWESDIVVEGDPESQQDIRLALYHLYAFSRADTDLSIAPMGLSSVNYNGHIFWDTELWMFPPLLMMNNGIAQSLLNYRVDRLDKARQKATNYGYRGAMFPWESDDTGEEATPSWALTGTFEHHITADVGIAFWNYYRVTGNLQWLKEKGYPVMEAVSDFWVSRANRNPDGSFSIQNVVGANEFAPNVDDNAFTNGTPHKQPDSWKQVRTRHGRRWLTVCNFTTSKMG